MIYAYRSDIAPSYRIATSQAMLDALKTLVVEKSECCRFYDVITGDVDGSFRPDSPNGSEPPSSRRKGKERATASSPESSSDTEGIREILARFSVEDPHTAGPSRRRLEDLEVDTDDELDDNAGRISPASSVDQEEEQLNIIVPSDISLNESQMQAIRSWGSRLSLIWGPPGTS